MPVIRRVGRGRTGDLVGGCRGSGGGDNSVAVGIHGRKTDARTEVAFKVVGYDDDARLDEHLPDRNIEGRDEAPDVGETFGRVLQQESVGTLVDSNATARRQERAALGLDERSHLGSLGVIHLQVLGTQRREFLDVLLRSEVSLLAGGQFFLRSDDDDVVLPALVQALRAQHDVERLVPRHVLQAQRDVAVHRIAHDDVLAAGVSKELQDRAGLNFLEVQCQALAGVLRLVLLHVRALRFGCTSTTY